MEISKTFHFEASHVLPRHPGKCSRLHGHSWILKVSVEGDINPETGFVMDYADLNTAVKPLIDKLDHRHLGMWTHDQYRWIITAEAIDKWFVETLPKTFYPSSENLIVWIGTQLHKNKGGVLDWSKLELNETCTSSCILTREEYDRITIRNGSGNMEETKRGS